MASRQRPVQPAADIALGRERIRSDRSIRRDHKPREQRHRHQNAGADGDTRLRIEQQIQERRHHPGEADAAENGPHPYVRKILRKIQSKKAGIVLKTEQSQQNKPNKTLPGNLPVTHSLLPAFRRGKREGNAGNEEKSRKYTVHKLESVPRDMSEHLAEIGKSQQCRHRNHQLFAAHNERHVKPT